MGSGATIDGNAKVRGDICVDSPIYIGGHADVAEHADCFTVGFMDYGTLSAFRDAESGVRIHYADTLFTMPELMNFSERTDSDIDRAFYPFLTKYLAEKFAPYIEEAEARRQSQNSNRLR